MKGHAMFPTTRVREYAMHLHAFIVVQKELDQDIVSSTRLAS